MTMSEVTTVRAPRVVEGPCRIFLVRHGTTRMNVENRYRGRADVPLDAQGYQEAVDAARTLSSAGLTAIYTGPLRRTIATAQIIADEAGVPDIRILQGLINLDYGVWQGMTTTEASAHDPRAFELYRTNPLRCVCPDGERIMDAQERMLAAVELIGSRHQGETVAAVSHAVMIRLLIAKLEGAAGDGWRVPVNRGGVIEFHVADGQVALITAVGAGSPDVEDGSAGQAPRAANGT
jgi:broad specificity phosphatase PhoE